MNKIVQIKIAGRGLCALFSTEAPSIIQSPAVVNREQKVSKAMKAYLERAKQHDDFIKTELAGYELGKRHLANMMGEDPENFSQAGIDSALEYLLPSGLFEPRARPVMTHPDLMFPKRKDAEFDISGRPHHYLFYTGAPNYFGVLHDIARNFEMLNKYEDEMLAKGIYEPDAHQKINPASTGWISYDGLKKLLLEEIREYEYDYFIKCMTTLTTHPYSAQLHDFIMKYRVQLAASDTVTEIPKLKYDEHGRPYMDAVGNRKKAVANVTVHGEGTGNIRINNTDISYFSSIQDKEEVLFPLLHTGLIDRVDVEAVVEHSGHTAQAGAVRYGISLALRSFVSTEQLELMRLAGLLTRDPRVRERKKPGQRGARRKYTWRKR